MIKPFTINDHKIRRLAFGFVLFLFVFEIYAVRVNYSDYFVYLFDAETWFFLAIAVICILISFYIFYRFIVSALSASWPYKVFYFLIFALSIFVEYGYQKALGRFSDKFDIETAVDTTTEQKTASIWMYVNLKSIIPCLVILLLFIFFRSEKSRGLKQFLVANVLIIVSFAIFPFVVDQKFPTFATAAFFRTNTDFLINGPVANGKWASDMTGVAVTRRQIPKPPLAENYRPGNNIIIVVGESVRGDHLSLNGYARETTPLLDKLASQNILHNWGIATAASTGSRFTYVALITGLTPDDFPDKTEFKVNTFPTVFQYAKAMNYNVHLFEGQMNGYWNGVDDDKNYFDNFQGVLDISDNKAFETWDLDNIIAEKVKRIIYSSTGNFIFILNHGSHIPYQIDFPPDQQIWKPSYETTNKFDIPSGDHLAEVANAYDNSIRYNLNSFFQNLIDDYTHIPNNSVIIYTGDHGQTLFVNGRSSHGGNTKEEATVPLFMIGTLDGKVDTAYKASHQNIFPTILDLIGYPAELREHTAIPSLLKARSSDSKPRFFNPDLGHKIPFD